MPACCIINCTSRTDGIRKNNKLFRFPTDKTIRKQWIRACRRNEKDININTGKDMHIQYIVYDSNICNNIQYM